MAEEVKVNETVTVTEQQPQVQEVSKTQTKQEVLRELSKELGINVFEADGLKQVKALIDAQKSEQEKLQETLEAYKTKEAEWQKQELTYKTKLKATELGIHADNLEDALKLAENDPEKLADVIKKYPMFKNKDGIKIGVQSPTGAKPPTANTEAEAYMAQNARYRKYLSGKK